MTKKLIYKDDANVHYLLDNGLTEVTMFNTRSGEPYTFVHAAYWHPHSLRHYMRDFSANSPISYSRLGRKLNSLGLCDEEKDDGWDLKQIITAIADHIAMNAKPWKNGITDDNRTVKEIYGTRENFKNYLLETFKEEIAND
jgi:hypothetical protein